MTDDARDQYPGMTLAAEGDGPGGERWSLRTWGSPAEYFRLFEVDYPDGSRDRGAMSGRVPPLYGLWESNERRFDRSTLLSVWADPRVRSLRVVLKSGEQYEVRPVKDDTAAGVTLFVALFPASTRIASVEARDADGQAFSPDEVGR